MNKFYFFKVTLIYYDDVTETIFLTPDQANVDEDGIPFSEQELRENAEFKAFVKQNKADVVDVKYVEYAVGLDNKSVILGGDITAEKYATLENHDELEIVEQNEFPVIIRQTKKDNSGERKTDFFNAVAWRGAAELICKYFGKGRMIFLEGEMQIRPYTDKKGNTAYCYEIIADRVSFTGERADSAAPSAPVPAPEQPESLPEYQPADGSDDYPF